QKRNRRTAQASALVHRKNADAHRNCASVASTTLAATPQLWLVSTRRRPAAPSSARRRGSACSDAIVCVTAATEVPSTSTPVRPSSTASISPPEQPASTGLPHAAASKY